jgi:hypothetical protein
MTGNKTDNGVLEQGTDEARISYSEDTPGQNVESFIKEREKAFHETHDRTKKHFSSVFGNPLEDYPYNDAIKIKPIKESFEELEMDEAKGLTKRIAGDSKFELLAVKSGLLKLSFVNVRDGDIFIGKEDFARFQKFISKIKPAAVDKAHQEIVEQIDEEGDNGLKAKAEKSGISLGILKQVYNRGLAAYKTGHRPGTTAPQWAFARVNSFITKGKGTWGGADKDLAAKVK